jgi:hypothetical protein
MGKALIAVAIAVLAAANASGAGAKSTHRIDGGVRDVSCPGAAASAAVYR